MESLASVLSAPVTVSGFNCVSGSQRLSFCVASLVNFGRLGLPVAAAAAMVSGQRRRSDVVAFAENGENLVQRAGVYTVGDFMTKKEELHVVKATTTVEDALEALVEKRITGFPVIDDDWKLVGVVSDYDLLALDSISGLLKYIGGAEAKTPEHVIENKENSDESKETVKDPKTNVVVEDKADVNKLEEMQVEKDPANGVATVDEMLNDGKKVEENEDLRRKMRRKADT